jgi:hypothetical protein
MDIMIPLCFLFAYFTGMLSGIFLAFIWYLYYGD